jgi:hypothetical protein
MSTKGKVLSEGKLRRTITEDSASYCVLSTVLHSPEQKANVNIQNFIWQLFLLLNPIFHLKLSLSQKIVGNLENIKA